MSGILRRYNAVGLVAGFSDLAVEVLDAVVEGFDVPEHHGGT